LPRELTVTARLRRNTVLGEIKKEQRHVGATPKMDESYEMDQHLVKDG
jgi:hypothetical protein